MQKSFYAFKKNCVSCVSLVCSFYDEIGTPLLSDIQVAYSDNSVQYVTQSFFPNYFNGSEIVVAGKLNNHSSDSLHVQVKASNNERDLVIEKDISLKKQESQTKRRLEEAEAGPGTDGYVERLWGFLSVKDGLNGRVRSHTSAERDNFTQLATELSLSYNFLTPLTQMEVETPQILEDGTVAQAERTEAASTDSAQTDLSNQLAEEETVEESPQSLHRKKEQPRTDSRCKNGFNSIQHCCIVLVLCFPWQYWVHKTNLSKTGRQSIAMLQSTIHY